MKFQSPKPPQTPQPSKPRHATFGTSLNRGFRAILAFVQLTSALGAAAVGVVRPQFAPWAGQTLGPWAQQVAQTLDTAWAPATASADTFTGLGTLTITKVVSGVAPAGQTYSVTVVGPSFTAPSTTLFLAGETKVITGLLTGLYTITEATPGVGWTTNYSATPGVTTSSSAVVSLTGLITAPLTAGGIITGQVYNDSNNDGLITVIAAIPEPGVPSVTVSAFDRDGTAAGTATTDANGAYTLTASGNGPYRLEFTTLPTDFRPSAAGAQNGTSTQFVAGGGAGDVDFGIHRANDYCQANARLATTCYAGGQTNSASGVLTAANLPAIHTWLNPTRGLASTDATSVTEATMEQVGATYGLAYQRTTKRLFVGSFAKRHQSYGNGVDGLYNTADDSGAIYALTVDDVTGGAVTPIATVPNAGNTARPNSFSSAEPWLRDSAFYDRPGKESLGDLELSEDGRTLYVINLNDQQLYAYDVSNPATTSLIGATPISDPGCVGGASNWRPFALKFSSGRLLVGGTCTAETTQNAADLSTYVLSMPAASFGTFTTAFSHTLAFARGETIDLTVTNDAFPPFTPAGTQTLSGTGWRPWNPTFGPANWQDSISFTLNIPPARTDTFAIDPQPLLTNLEVDQDGSLIFGFRDRFTDQMGYTTKDPNALPLDDSQKYTALATGGDLNRACWNAGLGTWEWEGTGACANHYAGSYGGDQPNGASNAAEYYPGEFWESPLGTTTGPRMYEETALGGLAYSPVFGSIASTAAQIVPGTFTTTTIALSALGTFPLDNGVFFSNNTSGLPQDGANKGYTIVNRVVGSVNVFAKTSGLGDLELLCDAAPIEIGNRVWNDVNGNGVQDPGEPPLAGVVVSLQTPSGTLATTTDVAGTYAFTREAATGPYSTTLRTNTAYTITVDPAQAALAGYSPTAANTQSISGSPTSNDAILDTRDSDAALVGGLSTIFYQTGGPGENNHGLDFGFTQPVAGSVIITNTAPVLTPGITLHKTTNGGAGLLIQAGQPVTWTYIVTNTGNTTLTIGPGELRDDIEGGINATTLTLAISEVMTLTKTGVVTAGFYTNTAVVTGTSLLALPVTSTAASDYFGYTPGIALHKTTNGGAGLLIQVGQPVTWTYIVTNTGDVTLTIGPGELRDDVEGGINATTVTLVSRAVLTLTKTGVATAGTYTNTATVTGTLPAGLPITDTETSSYFGFGPGIALHKTTNGGSELLIQVGQPVTWTYIVTNTGDVTLTIGPGELRDDVEGGINATTITLVAGSVLTLTKTGVATAGLYTNTAVVTGTSPAGLPVRSTAASNYFGYMPRIAFYKTTNGGVGLLIQVGQPVTWTYIVTNTGNITLTIGPGELRDDIEGGINATTVTLVAGAVLTLTKTGVATAGLYTNTAVVTGTSPAGLPVTSTAVSNYFGYTPGIAVRKFTNGYDGNSGAALLIQVGQPVTWTYVVTNTGNITLKIGPGELRDDVEGGINATAVTLAAGAVLTLTKTGVVTAGLYTNTAVVTGTSPAGLAVSSTDASHYFGYTPGIAVRKFTNGYDADTLPLSCNGAATASQQPCVSVGSPITWTYIVVNTGNVSLTNLTLVDDKVGGINLNQCAPNPAPALLPGQMVTCTATGLAVVGQYTNTAVVSGTFTPPAQLAPDLPGFLVPGAVPMVLTATNPSHYFAALDAFVLVKTVNRAVAQPGDLLIYTVTVTHTGSAPLVNALLSDLVPTQLSVTGASCVIGVAGSVGSNRCAAPTVAGNRVQTTLSLGVGGVAWLVIIGTLRSDVVSGTQIANTGVMTPAGQPPATTLPVTITVIQLLPVLRVAKTVNLGNKVSATIGDLITYTIVVSNVGAGVAYNGVVTDPLPAATSYVTGSAQPAATLSGNTLRWTVPALLPGQSVTLTFRARIDTVSERGLIVNIAYADADGAATPTPGTPPATASDAASVPVDPTAVVLTLFQAQWLNADAGVQVRWDTGSEINTFGFALYRSADGNRAHAVRVMPKLIPSKSVNTGGASYQFVDTTAEAGTPYTYWLQELETTGRLNEYGPVNTAGLRIARMTSRLFLPMVAP